MEYIVVNRMEPLKETDGWDSPYWLDVPVAEVCHFHPAGSNHKPVTQVKVTHSSNAIHVFFKVQDQYVRSVGTQLNDPVCQDSCVEFFIQPRPDKGYCNFELNAGGCLLMSYVEDPTRLPDGALTQCTMITPEQAGRITIRPSLPTTIEPELTEPTEWTMQYTIPLSIFTDFVGPIERLEGQIWRGNFFKCGDNTSHPHWACWSPIEEELNFHQPQYFGTIAFAAE